MKQAIASIMPSNPSSFVERFLSILPPSIRATADKPLRIQHNKKHTLAILRTILIPANTSSSVHCRSGEGGAQCASNKLVKFSNKKTKNATTMKTNKQNATSD